MIGILDMEMGNLRSVANAVHQLGFDPRVVSAPQQLDDLGHLIIPGVGQFATAMRQVSERGLYEPVRRFAAAGKPVMGICLGMHLLAGRGDEGGEAQGFELIPGRVMRLPADDGLRVPHVGWNRAMLRRTHPVLDGLKPDRDFYFVHSYAFRAANADDVLAEPDYGTPFASIVGRGNVVGLQFHPEKSQVSGLKLLDNFCLWDGSR